MLRIFFDVETYYDRGYTLSGGKITPIEYILDERWEMLGMGVAIEHEDPIFLPQEEGIKLFRDIKQPYAAISHNALFDASILAFRYNIHPNALTCTLSMARALLSHKLPQGKLNLGNVMRTLELGDKGDTVQRMVGVHYRDITPEMMVEWVGYTLNDVAGCRGIFFKLRDQLPPMEALIMDRVIRMTTQPKLHGDTNAIAQYYAEVVQEKEEVLSRVSFDKAQLMSNPQFAQLLIEYGVEPPMKTSPITNKPTYAFARTDAEFTALLDHDDVRVQTLVGARLRSKSTIEETRANRLFAISLATQNTFNAPLMPVPLKYSGAHTHRLSGDWKLNMQNLSARKTNRLRECLIAPPGHVVLAVDASQIEARLVAWLAQQENLLDLFASKADVYAAFATSAYGYPVNKKDHPIERFTGKTCVLGLGFGMAAYKLNLTLNSAARDNGLDVTYTESECQGYVTTYRSDYSGIPVLWRKGNEVLWEMVNTSGSTGAFGAGGRIQRIGPCKIEGTTILLPSGLKLYYEGLASENGELWFTYGGRKKKTYGAKLIENIVQALDRQHTLEAAVRTEKRAYREGISGRIVSQVHDENLYVVPKDCWERLAQIAVEEMRTPCQWASPEFSGLEIPLPLDAEVKVGPSYGQLTEVKM